MKVLKNEASSRKNFAALVVDNVFNDEEKAESNCSGTRGKKPLDQKRMVKIRTLVYIHFPIKQGEIEDVDWKRECVKAIDEKLRCKKKTINLH